jgi:uncharacterized membrane protein
MGGLLNFIELLAVSAWMGSILFFSFIVAPSAFRTLGEAEAGKLVRAVFPKYYLLGIICGIAIIAVHLARGFLWYWGGMTKPAIVLFALLTAIDIYARQRLTPAANAAREAGPAGKARFTALHRRSVILNAVVLLLGLLYMIWIAVRGY